MTSEDVTYRRDGDTLKAYAAGPDGTTDLGAVIVIPDVRGLTAHYRDCLLYTSPSPRDRG